MVSAQGPREFSRFRISVDYEKVFGQPPGADELERLTRELPRDETALFLAALAVDLEVSEWDEPQVPIAERFLSPPSVVDALRRVCQSYPSRPWLHAGMIVAGWRALALWGQPGLARDQTFGATFTRWVFLLSDAYNAAQEEVVAEEGLSPSDERIQAIAFALQNGWVQDREADFYAYARTYALLYQVPELLQGLDEATRSVQASAPEALGAPLSEYLAIGGALAAWFRARGALERPPQERLNAGVIEPARVFAPTVVRGQALESVLQKLSQTFDELAEACDPAHRDRGWWPTDLLHLMRFPLIKVDKPGYLAYCLPRFVVEAFTLGVYHRLFDHFREQEGRPDNAFASYWGKLVEAYTGRLLEEAFPVTGGRPRRVWLPGVVDMPGHVHCDGVVLYPSPGRTAIVLESVATHFRLRSLTGLDRDALSHDLDRIVVKKLRQLSHACSDLQTGATQLIHAGRPIVPTLFVPVLLTWRSMPTWSALMEFVDDLCAREGLFRGLEHVPVQILTMEELEALLDLVSAGRSFLWMLKNRGESPSERTESMRNYLYKHSIEVQPSRRLPFLERAFDDLHDLVMRTLSGSDTVQ